MRKQTFFFGNRIFQFLLRNIPHCKTLPRKTRTGGGDCSCCCPEEEKLGTEIDESRARIAISIIKMRHRHCFCSSRSCRQYCWWWTRHFADDELESYVWVTVRYPESGLACSLTFLISFLSVPKKKKKNQFIFLMWSNHEIFIIFIIIICNGFRFSVVGSVRFHCNRCPTTPLFMPR